MNTKWHQTSPNEILKGLETGEKFGLSAFEAEKRLKTYGPNKLPEAKADTLVQIFFRQFKSPLIYILLLAAAIVAIIGDQIDSIIILLVLVFNAVMGTVQEGRSQNILLALKRYTTTQALVIREGKEIIISDEEVVPGDILIVNEGEKVPADARIIFSNNLKANEAVLTGESEPVLKTSDTLKGENVPIADQKNMLWKGTQVVSGNGRVVVVATGIDTAVGKISEKLTTLKETDIPLKVDIKNLSRLIVLAVFIISAVIFLEGLWFGKSLPEMFKTIVSLAVSVIPEGLPIVMTLVLASGVLRMSKKNALVKKLQAVESLGQTRIIAVDKTGTLTKNELVIKRVYVDGKFFDIGGVGYETKDGALIDGKIIDPINHSELLFAAKSAAFCANARAMYDEVEKLWRISGDPTEASMYVFAKKMGFDKDSLEQESPLVAEIPFDYRAKYHTMVHQTEEGLFLTAVGAPENILKLCTKEWQKGEGKKIGEEERKRLHDLIDKLSQEGLRVLAFAVSHDVPKDLKIENIKNLTFGGFFGIKDALRTEVREAVRKSNEAGIRLVMITGDYKITAEAIAREAGIFKDGDRVLTGEEVEKMTEPELMRALEKTSVFARVTPEHKLEIINAFRKKGDIIAMTGDGVNDAPSLVAADLGVAMGKIGTEVAKEASDIVLLDDNFGNIVEAVEEGRSIYKTIKKVILYLFSTSIGEVFIIFGSILLGWPIPLLPAQIIWLNFVTDGFLDIALAMEPKEKGLLTEKFERPKKYLFDGLMFRRMIIMSAVMTFGTLLAFSDYMSLFGADPVKVWTISLTLMAAFQWFNAWNCRSEKESVFRMNPFSNKFLVAATVLVIGLQMLAVYNPYLQKILKTSPLSFAEWTYIISIGATILVIEEIRKYFHRKKARLAS
jgi:Ca2+-transporting ATPase